jgi:hypothetical protein
MLGSSELRCVEVPLYIRCCYDVFFATLSLYDGTALTKKWPFLPVQLVIPTTILSLCVPPPAPESRRLFLRG